MPGEGNPQALQAVLSEEARCTRALLDCLERERKALAQRDLDTVQTTTQEKLQLSERLEALERQRETLITGMGFGNDAEGLDRCFASLPQSGVYRRIWRQILNNIEACRNGNLANGGVLEASRQHVEQALCILRGQSGAPALYGQAGEAAADLGRRELGKV